MTLNTADAYRLFHQGALALAKMEANGIRVDEAYLEDATKRVSKRIERMQEKLKGDEIYKTWQGVYKERANLGSRDQLGRVIFSELRYPCKNLTRTGKPKTDEHSLKEVDLPFVRRLLRVEKLKKAKATSLDGLRKEVVDGFVHPNFNLHTVATFRSSGNSPNVQNVPTRNEKIGEIVRRCFVPRKGCVLVERDYQAIEVRVAACHCLDPVLVEYVQNPKKDMHRDMAAQIYKLKKAEVSKKARYVAKNQYVFPEFYGSVWFQCAPNLWEAIGRYGLQVEGSGVGLKEHLAGKGITELGNCDPKGEPAVGSFARYVREVEADFWGRRFREYAAWKDRWYTQYRERGWYETKTGFRMHGLYKRNEVLNGPIQCDAFQCLLWSLIRIQRELDRRKMRAKLVAEVHDSLLADVPVGEVQEFIGLSGRVMEEDIRKAWPWIVVPLSVECEVCSENWFQKVPWEKRADGKWGPKG